MYVWEYVCMYVWEYGNVCMGIWECGVYGNLGMYYGNMGMWYVWDIWECIMGIWECEDYSTHISATAELVFSAYIHVPAQAMLNLSTNKAFYYR